MRLKSRTAEPLPVYLELRQILELFRAVGQVARLEVGDVTTYGSAALIGAFRLYPLRRQGRRWSLGGSL